MIRKPLLTGMRAVAVIEGAKAAIVLLAGFGLLSLIHRDVQSMAERIVRHSHLDPADKYPRIFLDAADKVTDAHLWLLAGFAGLYSLVRAIEAYGLWNERRWAEWFALASSAIYLPVEIYEMWHRFGWIKAAVYLTNVAIVAYMAYALWHPAQQDRERLNIARPASPPPA
ncbi:MAG: DUF2127 domain-containing protein [Opitutaceae bacterium]